MWRACPSTATRSTPASIFSTPCAKCWPANRMGRMNRTLAIIGLATLSVFGLALYLFPVLSPLENRLLDRFVRDQAAALAPDPDIVLVDIDENSLVNMKDAGRFPW